MSHYVRIPSKVIHEESKEFSTSNKMGSRPDSMVLLDSNLQSLVDLQKSLSLLRDEPRSRDKQEDVNQALSQIDESVIYTKSQNSNNKAKAYISDGNHREYQSSNHFEDGND